MGNNRMISTHHGVCDRDQESIGPAGMVQVMNGSCSVQGHQLQRVQASTTDYTSVVLFSLLIVLGVYLCGAFFALILSFYRRNWKFTIFSFFIQV